MMLNCLGSGKLLKAILKISLHHLALVAANHLHVILVAVVDDSAAAAVDE